MGIQETRQVVRNFLQHLQADGGWAAKWIERFLFGVVGLALGYLAMSLARELLTAAILIPALVAPPAFGGIAPL
jgi:hypothetical protein